MNNRFRVSPLFWALLVFLLVALLVCVRLPKTVNLLLDDEIWSKTLREPASAGLILGGIVTGLLTVCAGTFTVLIYLGQRRGENLRSFLEWLSQLNDKFHSDVHYGMIRERLATRRDWVRRQLVMELKLDGLLSGRDLIDADKEILDMKPESLRDELDWTFLRYFTDYLYFFEQLLAFGEALAEQKSTSTAAKLTNHFGWFLRSICGCWSGDTPVKNASNGNYLTPDQLFIFYLANNRYRRLAEVALLLEEDSGGAFNAPFAKEISEILRAQSGTPPLPYSRLRTHWKRVIGARGLIRH